MQGEIEPGKYISNNEIYNILKDEILSLKLLPGQLLSENAVAKRFNVSRTPVRSVFDHLIKDELLEVNPRRGTFVTLLDLDTISQVIYMRIRVETGIMTTLARYPDQELFERLHDNQKQQEQEINTGMTPEAFYKLDSRFHELCMTSLNRQKLWQIIQKLNVHYSRYRMLDYVSTRRFADLYREHCDLLDCIESGKTERIEKHITEHFCGSFSKIGARLTTEFKDYFEESRRTVPEILEDIELLVRRVNEDRNEKNK